MRCAQCARNASALLRAKTKRYATCAPGSTPARPSAVLSERLTGAIDPSPDRQCAVDTSSGIAPAVVAALGPVINAAHTRYYPNRSR